MVAVQSEDPLWNHFLPLLSRRPGLGRTLFFQPFQTQLIFATWTLLNDIYYTIRALLDLSMDSSTLFPTPGP